MKRFRGLYLILLLAITTIFCLTACISDPNDESGNEEPAETKIMYEISVDASEVSVDSSEISVCVYSLDGAWLAEKKLSQGKTVFELDSDSYVATLGGLPEDVSYSSVMLTKNDKKATIVLEESKYNEYSESHEFAFTIIVLTEDKNVDDLDVQVCDDQSCRIGMFDNSNITDIYLNTGEYEIKVCLFSDDGMEELYHENYTVTLDKRFYIINL